MSTITCRGCAVDESGANRMEYRRLDYRHATDCPRFDAFYDATDDELSEMVSNQLGEEVDSGESRT